MNGMNGMNGSFCIRRENDMKRFTVITKQTPRSVEYRIYDSEQNLTLEGDFGTLRWAERYAEMLEEKNGENRTKSGNTQKAVDWNER